MLTTVTLNAAIDKTYFFNSFTLGTVSRTQTMRVNPGGKGLNVARVAGQLGRSVLATGFVGGYNGRFIMDELDRQGIAHDFVQVEGESRLCLNMIDLSNRSSTEVLEPGPEITSDQVEEMKRKIRQLAAKSAIVALSGSVPRGAPTSIYAELIAIAKAEGARVFLDASGDALMAGITAIPEMIKPNEDEVERIIGKKLEREEDLIDSVRELMERGIKRVIVTLGAAGSLAGVDGRLYRIRAPKLDAVNTVGCGDSFVAGMASAVLQGMNVEDSLRLATAAGSANALTEEAGNVRLEDVDALFKQTVIECL
ncbi:MAG: tagatose-6-phosphate kinase [Paenibacillaceae bacterium]|jgi:tagatose 6-phosphate kinase|nr:tagatose-6-phosphate kinase [Paenibacillaceae bacterium]